MIYKRIKEVANLLNGYAFKSKNYVESGIRVIRIANVQDGFISDEKPCFYPDCSDDEIGKYMLQEGDLLISLTGNVGRVGLLTKEFLPAALNQRVSCIRIKPDVKLELPFLYYFLLRKQFVRDCIKASKGVAQLNLSTKWLENYLIPVPDLEAQKRIVSQIEESLSQLDSAVETLKKTKQQLEVYRQAVLKEAFSNCIAWKQYILNDLALDFRNGYGKKPDDEGEYRILRISAVRSMSLNLKDYRLNKTRFTENELIKPYDLLFTRYNGSVDYVGVCSCVEEIEYDYAYPDKIIRCRLKNPNKVLAKFLAYYLNQGEARQYIRNHIKTTSGQHGIASGDIKKISVYIPNDSTQKRIVSLLENRLSNCEKIEITIDASLNSSEALRQNILKQAFEEK